VKTKGLTLTEIMISVSIIGLISAIAIPAVTNFRETAYQTICHKNLQAIDNAKLQWAMTEEEPDDAEPTEEDMAGYIRGDFPQPVVAGALYNINDVVTPALCTFHGNGFIDGFGMTFPNSIVKLVEVGDLTPSDVIDGDWIWSGKHFTTFQYPDSSNGSYRSKDGTTIECYWPDMDKTVDTDSNPELNINGENIKGIMISCYSKESIEYHKEYFKALQEDCGSYNSATYEESYLSKMDQGGYEVRGWENGNPCYSYYGAKGDLIGYVTFEWGGSSVELSCYDGKGNLLN